MSKAYITNSITGSRIPFLRGILAHSLQDSGMAFDEAHQIASDIRESFAPNTEITSLELRNMVVEHLKKIGATKILDCYSEVTLPAEQITIIYPDGTESGFSENEYQLMLESCGLSHAEASVILNKFREYLLERGKSVLPESELGYTTYSLLEDELGKKFARSYLVWWNFLASDKPLLLLIGGTTGCGKSTISTEIAHALNIVRTQSSDMLREVMRIMVPAKLLPVLHKSSFNAFEVLPQANLCPEDDSDSLLMDGFRTQAELLSVSLEAVINRAVTEKVSFILEGIHITPALLDKIPADIDAPVVMIMLAVLNQSQLKKQIKGRGKLVPKRRAKRYLNSFDHIWNIQSNLLDEADQRDVPIVINKKKEKVLQEIMKIIIASLRKGFDGPPEKVFKMDDSD